MYTTNNNFKVFVANVDTANTVTGADLSSITAGEIVAIGDNDIALDNSSPISTSTVTSIKFAQKTSTGITHFSDRFKVKDIVAMSYKIYTAPVEQITYVGWNGTSGNIQAIDYNEYILSLIYKHDDMMWSEQINIKPYLVTTESGATASVVACNVAKGVNEDSYSKVKAEAVCSTAGTELLGAADTVLGYDGSDKLVITEVGGATITYAATVGDFIRIGTAVTDPVYRITSGALTAADGGTLTLDRPLSADVSGTATGIIEYITAAEGLAASWGVKFTGIALDWVAKGVFPYKQVSFDVTLKGFGTTTQSTTGPTQPMGYYKQVSDLEWFSQFGSDGLRNATQHPVPTGRSETSSSITYACWTIKYKGTAESDPIVGASNMTATIYIFAPSGATAITNIYTNILASLATNSGVAVTGA